jgi:hypothetical protein
VVRGCGRVDLQRTALAQIQQNDWHMANSSFNFWNFLQFFFDRRNISNMQIERADYTKTIWLKTTEIYFLMVLEAGILRARCQHTQFLVRSPCGL